MLDKSPQTIRRLFDQIAPRYDLINHCLSLGIDYSWRRRSVELIFSDIDATSPGPVLDVCCGTGDFAIAWHRKLASLPQDATNITQEYPAEATDSPEDNSRLFHDQRKIVGVDFSSAMLEIGRKKIAKIAAEKDVVLWQGDALALPFAEKTFSAVSVGFGLRNVVDPDRGLAEMVRVTRPGGIVAVLDFDLPNIPLVAPLYRFYLTKVLPGIGKCVSRNREGAYHYFSKSVMQFEKGEAFINKLRDAGLQQVKMRRMTCGVATLYWGKRD